MYHLNPLLISILTFFSGVRVLAESTPTTLAFDTNYDNSDLPLSHVACSDGVNGLETKNHSWTTLGSLPNYPNVGGVYTVAHWDSAECGTCYAVKYGNNTVNILAVDVSHTGFTVSEAAMNTLTNGEAVEYGRVDVSFVQVPASACGMPTSN